jgi:hypothetical protein
MKKQKKKQKSAPINIPTGVVITDLVVWCFDDTEEIIRHTADQLAKAIQMSFSLSNFGPTAFGYEEGESE